MTGSRRWAAAAVASMTLALGACGDESILVQPRSFNRPGPIAFLCLDGVVDARRATSAVVAPLADCGDIPTEDPDDSARRLLALVTQTGRGEIASADVTVGRVIDADARVPGHTFIRVGEVPSGIVVLPDRPSQAFVASFAERRVEAIETHRFHPQVPDPDPSVPAPAPVPLPAGPTGLVAAPDGSALYAPLPAAGAVARLPVIEGDPALGEPAIRLGEPELIMIGTVAEPEPVDLRALTEVPPQADLAAYRRLCTAAPLTPPDPAVAPRAPVTAGEAPRPVAVEVNADVAGEGYQLLVADEHRPVIHRLAGDATGVTEMDPLPVAVPTRDLVLTPEVPATLELGASAPARYLYAIDAIDQSVLAVDVLEGSPSFGAVLPVSTGEGPSDRLDLAAGARVLEVVTPGFGDMAVQCTPDSPLAEDASPERLRGVFLVAGLTDGTVRFVDVADLDAFCRGRPSAEQSCTPRADLMSPNELDVRAFIGRHRPRIAERVQRGITLTGPPEFSLDGIPGQVLPDGTIDTGPAPGLWPVNEALLGEELDAPDCPPFELPFGEDGELPCPVGMTAVFPDQADSPPLVCALADVWALEPERWTAQWEGAIPQTRGGRGRFALDEPLFRAPGTRFCDRGVLGTRNVPRAEALPADVDPTEVPELGYPGDVLVVTSELPEPPPGDEIAPECERFAGALEERDEIAFEILDARRVSVPLGEDRRTEGELLLGASLGLGASVREVAGCFGTLVGFEIRTQEAYTVTGTRSGFLHRVTLQDPDGDGAGSCAVDFDIDPLEHGRARPGCPYANPIVAFRTRPFDVEQAPLTSDTRAALQFTLDNVPATAALHLGAVSQRTGGRDSGVLPHALVFNPRDDRLYAVDIGQRRLLQIGFDPLRITQALQ